MSTKDIMSQFCLSHSLPIKVPEVVFSDEIDKAKKYALIFLKVMRYIVRDRNIQRPCTLLGLNGSKIQFCKDCTHHKSLTVGEVFRQMASIKKALWGGEFWTDVYYINTVSKRDNEDIVRQYVKKRGEKEHYKQLHYVQLKLF